MTTPSISVLIVSVGDSPSLRECLDRVRAQAQRLGAEIILVLNAAPDAVSETAVEALSARCDRLVFEPTPGKSQALNRGVDLCRGEVIAFTDDDTQPQPGWLEALTAPLLDAKRPAELVGCGGRVTPIYPTEGPPDWYRAMAEAKPRNFIGPRHEPGDEPFDYALGPRKRGGIPIGANVAFRRDVFVRYRYDTALGPNRATGMRGGEDAALARSLMNAGLRLRYVPTARVYHPVAPERMRRDFVRRAHFARGCDHTRLRRKFGLPLPTRTRLKLTLLAGRVLLPLQRIVDPGRHPLREFRLEFHRGRLDELEGGAGDAPPGRVPR